MCIKIMSRILQELSRRKPIHEMYIPIGRISVHYTFASRFAKDRSLFSMLGHFLPFLLPHCVLPNKCWADTATACAEGWAVGFCARQILEANLSADEFEMAQLFKSVSTVIYQRWRETFCGPLWIRLWVDRWRWRERVLGGSRSKFWYIWRSAKKRLKVGTKTAGFRFPGKCWIERTAVVIFAKQKLFSRIKAMLIMVYCATFLKVERFRINYCYKKKYFTESCYILS